MLGHPLQIYKTNSNTQWCTDCEYNTKFWIDSKPLLQMTRMMAPRRGFCIKFNDLDSNCTSVPVCQSIEYFCLWLEKQFPDLRKNRYSGKAARPSFLRCLPTLMFESCLSPPILFVELRFFDPSHSVYCLILFWTCSLRSSLLHHLSQPEHHDPQHGTQNCIGQRE